MTRAGRTVLTGLLAVSAAAVAPTTASGVAAPDPLAVGHPVEASESSPFRPGCTRVPSTGPDDVVSRNAEVEPFVAADPSRPGWLVGVWQQDRWSSGGANGLVARYSRDGGRTWRDSELPEFSRCADGGYERASDPWVTFSPDGTAYFMALAFDNDPARDAMLVVRSRDGGRTWGPVTALIRNDDVRFFNDKNTITADPTDPRYAYAVWDRVETLGPGDEDFTGPTLFTRTTDGGRTWERPRVILATGRTNLTIGNQIAVTPDGTLVNVFAYFVADARYVAVQRSTDHGRTWSKPIVVNRLGTVGVVDPRDEAPVRTGDIIPDIAVDPRRGHDEVYVVWQDARPTGGERDQVVLSRSTDGGRTWSAPERVSSRTDTQAFTASVHVNARGQLLVTYYDFSRDTTENRPLPTDYWATRSLNGGRSWSARERVTPRSFDMRDAPVAAGFFVGDYVGLDSSGSTFYTLYGAAVPGSRTNRTGIFAAAVRVRGDGDDDDRIAHDVGTATWAVTGGRTPKGSPAPVVGR
jgi:hypothetical protein